LLAIADDNAAADRLAKDHNPDYDPHVDCRRLRYNQASATYGSVAEVVWQSAISPHEDWGATPTALNAKACEIHDQEGEHDGIWDADAVMDSAIDALGWVLLVGDGQPGTTAGQYYLVDLDQ